MRTASRKRRKRRIHRLYAHPAARAGGWEVSPPERSRRLLGPGFGPRNLEKNQKSSEGPMSQTDVNIRRPRPDHAFVTKLRSLMQGPNSSVRALAECVKIDVTRMHQILAATTPPPGPEVVDRIAFALGLEGDERWTLHWLAVRDRADPHSGAGRLTKASSRAKNVKSTSS